MNTALSCLSFRNVSFDVVDRAGQPWLRSSQVAEALGYKNSESLINLYQSNADEFTEAMTALVKLPNRNGDAGQMREVRIFSLRGCHLLGMFARTAPAKEFRKWVLDVLERYSAQAQPQPQPLPQKRVIKSRDDLSFTARDSEGRLQNWVVPHVYGSDWAGNVEIGKALFAEVMELAQHDREEARKAVQYALVEGAAPNFPTGGWGIERGFAQAMAAALFVDADAKKLPRKTRGAA